VLKIEKTKEKTQIIIKLEISPKVTLKQCRELLKTSEQIQKEIPTPQEEIRRKVGNNIFYKFKDIFKKINMDDKIREIFDKEDKNWRLFLFDKVEDKGSKRKVKTIKQSGILDTRSNNDNGGDVDG
tara:strand:- start:16065 stop:16442 length:378 start_codon:yes stop_codon:yes gene_type:complete